MCTCLLGGSAGPPRESEAICFKSSPVNNGGSVVVAAQEGGKNGVHQVEAGGLRLGGLRNFHVCYLEGDEATNRAETQKPAPPETADALTSPLICLSCGLDVAQKLLQAHIVHV